MNEFLHRLHGEDRVLLVGDKRQHEAVEAGRPYHQLQQAGMQTARLDEIVRQKDPALKEAVEQLARGDVFGAIDNLDQQGRVHDIVGREERLSEIAREYAREPQGTLVISPDNESRRELNGLIHREMQERGEVSQDEHKLRVLDSRQDMTGADRQWAAQYEEGDVVRYTRGSKVLGIEPGEYARVAAGERDEKIASPSSVRTASIRPTIRADWQVWRCITKPSARSPKATACSSQPHQGTCTLRIASWALSRKSTALATSNSAWTQAATWPSISASIRISITGTQ